MGRLRFGLYVASSHKSPFEVAEQAQKAEEAGFDSFWFTDHLIDDNIHLEHGETWTSLTLAATRTNSIKLGSGVTDPFRRHPSVTAQTVATLDQISSGRAILGMGAGEAMNLEPFGVHFDDPVRRLEESIIVIRRLWQGSAQIPVSFRGNILSLTNAFLQITPIQKPSPPIYVGALSRKTREIAGKYGDGWLPWINSPTSYQERLKDVEKGAKEAGKSLNDIDTVATVDVAVSSDREKARKSALSSSKTALVLERSLLREMNYRLTLPASISIQRGIFTKDTMALLDRAIIQVPDRAAEQICAFGTADDCITKLEQYVKAGAKHILISNQGPDERATLDAIANEVIPYLRSTYSDISN